MKFVPQCHDSFEHAPTIVFLELTKRKPALETTILYCANSLLTPNFWAPLMVTEYFAKANIKDRENSGIQLTD